MSASKESYDSQISNFRELSGPLRWVQHLFYIAIAVAGILFILNVNMYLGYMVYKEQYCGVFLGLVLSLIFLGLKSTKTTSNKVPWYDLVLVLLSLSAGFYLAVQYPVLVFRLGYVTVPNVIFGSMLVITVLEALRREVGLALFILVSVFIFYGLFTDIFPGMLHAPGTSWDYLVNYLYLDPNTVLYLVGIAATVALAFILFGQILFSFGGLEFISDFCLLVMGRFRGGPAKVAVVASSLFGTMVGGSLTNVMVTGSFTIPMMKSAGYRPHMAAAIEAVSSTGGQIMPPVMGIAAFVIAEFLEIPYAEVALAAVIPAVLYYFAVFIQIDLEAGKLGMKGLSARELPRPWPTLRKSWLFIIPMGILVYTLFIIRFDAATAGVVSSLAAIVVILFKKENRSGFGRKLLDVIVRTGRTTIQVGAILAGAGFVIAVLSISGLGGSFAMMLVHISGENLFVLLAIAAIGCMILGMGLPSTAAYILVAILVGPALVQMGIMLLGAHLFIFYFAAIHSITPPVAVASYGAAALAGANPVRTSFTAMRLGILAYIVPFLFVLCPSLLLKGTAMQIIGTVFPALLGTAFVGVAFSGFLFRELSLLKRLLALLASIGFLLPLVTHSDLEWVSFLAAAGIASIFLTSEAKWPAFRRLASKITQPTNGKATKEGGSDKRAKK